MTIDTSEIEQLVSTIKKIKNIVHEKNRVVSGQLLVDFWNYLKSLQLNHVTHQVSILEGIVNDLFEEVYINMYRKSFTMTDRNLMHILVLLVVNKNAKVFSPKNIRHWIIVREFLPLAINEIIVMNLLEDSVSNTNSSWLSALLLVRMYATTGGVIGCHLLPKGFYKKLEIIFRSNKDFTTTNYLLELTKYLPRAMIYKDSQISSLTLSITQKSSFLLEIPSSVTSGSFEIVHFLNSLNNTFQNLYQLKSICSKTIELNKSFEKGDLIFLQVIDKVMILWCSNEEDLEPSYINLNNLARLNIVNELEIRLELSKQNKFCNTYSLAASNLKSMSLTLHIELKKVQLIPSLIKVLRSVIVHNLKKISIATTTISATSQSEEQDSPNQAHVSHSSAESQLSDIGLSNVNSSAFPNCQMPSLKNLRRSGESNSACKTIQSTLEANSSIKEKLRNYKKNNKHIVSIPPPKFSGNDPLSIKPLQSQYDKIKFKDFLDTKKQKTPRASSIPSSEPTNHTILPTPTKIISDLQKVSKRYGKRIKKQSYKRDIWDFSSSVPSSPLRNLKMTINPKSTEPIEPEYLAHSIIPDSLSSPTLLVAENNTSNNKKTVNKCNAQRDQSFEVFATKSKSRKGTNNENSSMKTNTFKKVATLKNSLYNNLYNNTSSEKNNSIQVEDSSPSHDYIRGKPIRNFLDSIAKHDECVQRSIDNLVNDAIETNDVPFKINNPANGNSTTLLDHDKWDNDTTPATDETKLTNEKPIDNIQKNFNENSILEDTTMKTSFIEYGSTLTELNISKQYSLIHEGMNLLSSNIINRIKKFENDIFQKQKELHEELEENFKQIAINYCENLKNFNNYVKKKSDEIFKDFQ